MASGEQPYVVDIPEGSQHQQCSWRDRIQDRVKNYNRDEEEKYWTKTSIYHLPEFAKKMKESDLTPQVVSFGPYHHGKANLKRIEDYKPKVLVHFLLKAGRPLTDFITAIEQVLEELRGSYDHLEDEWIKDEEGFVKLMITDGCFMLEILRLDPATGDKSYPDHDPIFSLHGALHKLPYIKRDMLMLENQIPLLVLKVLMQVEAVGKSRQQQVTDVKINELVYNFYNKKTNGQGGPLGLHVLDLYRKSMIITGGKSRSPVTDKSSGIEAMQTAVKLRECGVRFRKSGDNSISFDNGELKLPILSIDDSTKSIFLNLMAFEHLHVGVRSEISSYLCFMDKLVDSEQDVHLLAKKGIIKNAVGSEKAVAEILNSLTEEITLDPTNEFEDVSDKVFKYSQKKIHKWGAILRHQHFNNPWSGLAVITAILLLVMTAVQTVYTAIGYYHGKN
ncbi:hypothetical protein J5N97_022169 [Dioscorea zingiberensis]|uniref:Uncharacterized protein n=1 Tax=Dioscorea zingiberensis TaxID=325984 RepID=A0A9D5CA04_9LILI|nr:hypothetical protein J5N97_022169 [Dioscorea zingiberensis]